jgi:hypothetical protein
LQTLSFNFLSQVERTKHLNNVKAEKWTKEEAVENIIDTIGIVGHLCSDIVNGIFDDLRGNIAPNDIISEEEVRRLAADYVDSIDPATVEAGQFDDDVVRNEIYAAVKREIKTVVKECSND